MTDAQTTYDRATSAYDKKHERALLEAITAIFESSTVSDTNAIVIRTGEAAEALLTVLAGILAMSPAATRSPTAIRRTLDDLGGKRLRRQIAAAERSEDLQEFIRRTFRGNDVEGTA
jgi:2-oxo-4-hydroxy-4-carboxy--5-ureidoimidazoline (OHCU) decarboxylase